LHFIGDVNFITQLDKYKDNLGWSYFLEKNQTEQIENTPPIASLLFSTIPTMLSTSLSMVVVPVRLNTTKTITNK